MAVVAAPAPLTLVVLLRRLSVGEAAGTGAGVALLEASAAALEAPGNVGEASGSANDASTVSDVSASATSACLDEIKEWIGAEIRLELMQRIKSNFET